MKLIVSDNLDFIFIIANAKRFNALVILNLAAITI